MDLISIIVPIYKVEQYLDCCVESIINQTYRNLEIILVDDGSPDNCPSMCDAWKVKDTRIRVIHKENGGLSDARNAGMKVATGEYIGFVDSDDWIAPEMYERLMEALFKDSSDIAACTVKIVWESKKKEELLTVKENIILNKIQAQEALLIESKLKQPVWYKLYKKSTIKGIHFEKGKQHEDVFWSYQVIGRAKKVSVIDYAGYYYRQRNDSIMGNGYTIKSLDAMEAYCKRYEYIREKFPELERTALCAIWEMCIYQGQMALTYLKDNQRQIVFNTLDEIQRKYRICHEDYKSMKFSHRIWLGISRISLIVACVIKKQLKIGI